MYKSQDEQKYLDFGGFVLIALLQTTIFVEYGCCKMNLWQVKVFCSGVGSKEGARAIHLPTMMNKPIQIRYKSTKIHSV